MHKSDFVRLRASEFSISRVELLEGAIESAFRCVCCNQVGAENAFKWPLLGGKRTSELTLEFRERGVQEIELIFIGDLSLGCLQEIRRPLCCE